MLCEVRGTVSHKMSVSVKAVQFLLPHRRFLPPRRFGSSHIPSRKTAACLGLPGCLAACLAVWLFGGLAAWLPGFLAA